jgi:ribosome biogenesis GTPase
MFKHDEPTNSDHHGVVTRKTRGSYTVSTGERMIPCAISSKLRKNLEGWFDASASTNIRRRVKAVHGIAQVDPVAIGDAVRFVEAGDGSGLIVEVLPRRNALSRPAPVGPKLASDGGRQEQVIVANVDQIIPVFAIRQPAPKWNLLDRYLVGAEAAGIPALICITKVDLGMDDGNMAVLDIYREVGYRVMLTSAADGTGIDAFRRALSGRVSVFIGKSGVGKTSLLNAVQPELGLQVAEISQSTGKGRHTTSHLEMFPLDEGGGVVDTPGMREFGIWEKETDLALFFPEMRRLVGQCRFGLGCSHTHEPGCAIRSALAGGQISERRYRSFLRLLEE